MIVLLRYIDAFREDLTGGRPLVEFLADDLGITLNLPEVILKQCSNGQKVRPAIQLAVPLSFGAMYMKFADGTIDKQAALIMDTSVAFTEPMEPNVDRVMDGFSTAQAVIHDVFIGLTGKIAELMKPTGGTA